MIIHIDRVITPLAEQQGLISKDPNSEPELCHCDHLFLWKTSLALSSSGTHPKCELLNQSAYFLICVEAGGGSV